MLENVTVLVQREGGKGVKERDKGKEKKDWKEGNTGRKERMVGKDKSASNSVIE